MSLDQDIESALSHSDVPVEELIKLGLEAAACILVSEDMARGSSADEPIDAAVRSVAQSTADRLRALLPRLEVRCGQPIVTPEQLCDVASWLLPAFVRRINAELAKFRFEEAPSR